MDGTVYDVENMIGTEDYVIYYPALPRRIAHKPKNTSEEYKNSAHSARSEKDNEEKYSSNKDSSVDVGFLHEENKDMKVKAQRRVRQMTPTDFMALNVKKPERNSPSIDSKTGGRSNTYSRFRKWSESRQNNLGSDRKGWNRRNRWDRWSYDSTESEEREDVLRDMGGNIPQ